MQQRFLLQILLLAQQVSGTTMPIIRSSRVLYSGCCLWYFVLWFSSCWSGVELRVMCPVCRMLQHPETDNSFLFTFAYPSIIHDRLPLLFANLLLKNFQLDHKLTQKTRTFCFLLLISYYQ